MDVIKAGNTLKSSDGEEYEILHIEKRHQLKALCRVRVRRTRDRVILENYPAYLFCHAVMA